MTPKILIAGIAVAAMSAAAGQALAASHSGGAYAEPTQPIAYSNLGRYLKASPRAKRTRDWSGGTAVAAANAGSNVSATTPPAANGSAMPTVSPQADATAPAQPPANNATAAPGNAQPPAANPPLTTDTPAAAPAPAAPAAPTPPAAPQ